MEKLRRVLSGQDDEEQGLTAQVGSPRRPGAAERGAGPGCRTCSRREVGAPGRSGVRRGSLGPGPAPWAFLAPRSPLAAPSLPGQPPARCPSPAPPPCAREDASRGGAVCFGRGEPGAQSAGHGGVSSTESELRFRR